VWETNDQEEITGHTLYVYTNDQKQCTNNGAIILVSHSSKIPQINLGDFKTRQAISRPILGSS